MDELVIAFNRSAARVHRLMEHSHILVANTLDKIPYVVMTRSEADSNLAFVHPITYMVVMNEHNEVFMYQRGNKGKESRLHKQYSIGVGGHINPIDSDDLVDTIIAGANEELESEIGITTPIMNRAAFFDYRECPAMSIYAGKQGHIEQGEDSVHDYHLGLLKLVRVHSSQLGKHEEGVINNGGFVSIDEVRNKLKDGLLEDWSIRAFILYLANTEDTDLLNSLLNKP